jgi:ribosomal-protein-alanine N-acetyltransferase
MESGRRRRSPPLTSTTIRIRDYRSQDFNPLWQMDQQCFPPGIAYSRFELMCFLRAQRSFSLVAEEVARPPGGEPALLGFLVAEQGGSGRRRLGGDDRGHLVTLDVVAAARRKGIASRLMDEAEARLVGAGCTVCYLEVAVTNEGAIAFYRRRAYQTMSRIPGYYGPGLDALVMARMLPAAPDKH